MSSSPAAVPNRDSELLALYDDALPEVYGYLLRRCSDSQTAEDLTAETFRAAAAVRNGFQTDLNIPWLWEQSWGTGSTIWPPPVPG